MFFKRTDGKTKLRRKCLYAFIIVALILLVIHLHLTYRIHRFTVSICENTIKGQSLKNPDIVSIHDTLLDGMKNDLISGYRISVVPYDACEFEFPKVTHSAFISTKSQERALRIRYDPFRNQFHIVGWWTVR